MGRRVSIERTAKPGDDYPPAKDFDQEMARTQCHRISQKSKGLTNCWAFGRDAKGEKTDPQRFEKIVVEPRSQGEVWSGQYIFWGGRQDICRQTTCGMWGGGCHRVLHLESWLVWACCLPLDYWLHTGVYCPVNLLPFWIVGATLVCIAQLLDSITLMTLTESPAARDVMVYVDRDRTDRHGMDFKVCEWRCDGSFSPGVGHRNWEKGPHMSAHVFWDLSQCKSVCWNLSKRLRGAFR